jgi:hypothetical protein
MGNMRSAWSLWVFFWKVPHRGPDQFSKFELLPDELFAQICSQCVLEALVMLSLTNTRHVSQSPRPTDNIEIAQVGTTDDGWQ